MPLTKKGKKVMASLKEQYGERAEEVFYAMKNKGKLSGVDAMTDLFEEDARRKTIVRGRKGEIKETREEEEEDSLVSEVIDASPITMYDTLELDDEAHVQLIDGGYLKAMPRIARTGIQIYKGSECGRDDVDRVRVYRPQDSVFADSAVHSYTHLPITLEHPGVAVDSSNWRKHAIGETGDEVLRDGNSVRVPMMLRDAAAIRAVRDGKNQLSVGYACDLEWGEGVTADGDKYDAVQRNIRGNHLAVVSTARGGPSLKIGDSEMTDLKTLVVDGINCQMSDISATVVQKTIKGLQDQIENFKKKKKDEEDGLDEALKDIEKKDAALKIKDAEIVDLQAKLKDALSPARLDQAVKDRAAIIDKATKIAGKQIKVDGMTDADIKREIVNGKLGDVAKGWDDNKVDAAFDAITVTSPASPIKDAVAAFNRPGFSFQTQVDARDQAYLDSVKEDENAWRRKPAQ